LTPIEVRLKLSDKEFEAGRLARKGYKPKEVASKMGITANAARKYIAQAKKKLGSNYQNGNVFGGAEEYVLNSPKNWKYAKCGREITQEKIASGWTSMAYKKFGQQGDEVIYGEKRLAYAINGLGDRKYLMSKRGEALKALSAASRYKIIKLELSMITPEIQKVIDYYGLKLLRTDLPGLREGDTSTRYYVCKRDIEFQSLMGAVVGSAEVSNDNLYKELTIQFEKFVYVEYVKVIDRDAPEDEPPLIYKTINKRHISHQVRHYVDLEQGKNYLVRIGVCGAQLELDLKFTENSLSSILK
jgi:transposase